MVALGSIYMAANVVSAVLLVLLNKLIMSSLGFRFSICLTFFHTIATTIGKHTAALSPAPK